MLTIAVFASGRGSNFDALYRTILKEQFPARIAVVISNNSQSGVLELARSYKIPAIHLSQRQFPTAESFQQKVLSVLHDHNVNFIVLAGYMKRIDPAIIRAYRQRIINIHPALLPKYGGEGMYGMHVHEAVLKASEKFSGATVHLVDEQYDNGKILLQDIVEIDNGETPESLAAKVLKIEHRILPEVVRMFAEGTLKK
ncbi:MAG: phosphoribosylglycinamide formyltransferase [Bacteroidota bacterium]